MTAPTQGRDRIEAVLAVIDLAQLAAASGLALKRSGREWTARCPFHADGTPSFTVYAKGGRQRYHCFGCGADGDAIGFVMQRDGLGFREALDRLAEAGGVMGAAEAERAAARARRQWEAQQVRDERSRAARRGFAERIWAESRPIADTPAEAYLAGRGLPPSWLRGRWMGALRFHPALRHEDTGLEMPAMVAAVRRRDASVMAAHRTFLTPQGSKAPVNRAKTVLGSFIGGAIRLSAGLPGEALAIGEGIETCLSWAALRQGAFPGVPVWAAATLENISGYGAGQGPRHPDFPGRYLPSAEPDPGRPGIAIPPGVRKLILLRDLDGDRAAAEQIQERARRRFAGEGIEVVFDDPDAGCDWNDMLRRPGALGRAA